MWINISSAELYLPLRETWLNLTCTVKMLLGFPVSPFNDLAIIFKVNMHSIFYRNNLIGKQRVYLVLKLCMLIALSTSVAGKLNVKISDGRFLSKCVYVFTHVGTPHLNVKVRGQLLGVCFRLLPCGSWECIKELWSWGSSQDLHLLSQADHIIYSDV